MPSPLGDTLTASHSTAANDPSCSSSASSRTRFKKRRSSSGGGYVNTTTTTTSPSCNNLPNSPTPRRTPLSSQPPTSRAKRMLLKEADAADGQVVTDQAAPNLLILQHQQQHNQARSTSDSIREEDTDHAQPHASTTTNTNNNKNNTQNDDEEAASSDGGDDVVNNTAAADDDDDRQEDEADACGLAEPAVGSASINNITAVAATHSLGNEVEVISSNLGQSAKCRRKKAVARRRIRRRSLRLAGRLSNGKRKLPLSDEEELSNSGLSLSSEVDDAPSRQHSPDEHSTAPKRLKSSPDPLTPDQASPVSSHPYPLRSRLRCDLMRQHWNSYKLGPARLDALPYDVMIRILRYLNIRDLFRIECVCRRLQSLARDHLLTIKRINFTDGLPFAYLPASMTTGTLKRILSSTPNVTHILGFFPRHIAKIADNNAHHHHQHRLQCTSCPFDPEFYADAGAACNEASSLSYTGILAALRSCRRLRSVEIMGVSLMTTLISRLPAVKLHGMFRNRPDSWDHEYAIELPPETGGEQRSSRCDTDHSSPPLPSVINQHAYLPPPLSNLTLQPNPEAISTFNPQSVTLPLIPTWQLLTFVGVITPSVWSTMLPYRFSFSKRQTVHAVARRYFANLPSYLHNQMSFRTPLPLVSPCKSTPPINDFFLALVDRFIDNIQLYAPSLHQLSTLFDPVGELPLSSGSTSFHPHTTLQHDFNPHANHYGLMPWLDRGMLPFQHNTQPPPPPSLQGNINNNIDPAFALRRDDQSLLTVGPLMNRDLGPLEVQVIVSNPLRFAVPPSSSSNSYRSSLPGPLTSQLVATASRSLEAGISRSILLVGVDSIHTRQPSRWPYLHPSQALTQSSSDRAIVVQGAVDSTNRFPNQSFQLDIEPNLLPRPVNDLDEVHSLMTPLTACGARITYPIAYTRLILDDSGRLSNVSSNNNTGPSRRCTPHYHPGPVYPKAPPSSQAAKARSDEFYALRSGTEFARSGLGLVSPMPCPWSSTPMMQIIGNVTKLDLVSVTISSLTRLDNVKYLYMKWVRVTSEDPFSTFSAPKLQTLVVNNCQFSSQLTPWYAFFRAVLRCLHLTRLELVGLQFIRGLIRRILLEESHSHNQRRLRNLQRLVLSGNRGMVESDVGLMLLTSSSTLGHLALPASVCTNSFFECLAHSEAVFDRLESLVLGYQDPYQSQLTASELDSLDLIDYRGHRLPWSQLSDWSLHLALTRFARSLVNLTVKQSPFLRSPRQWFASPDPPTGLGLPELPDEELTLLVGSPSLRSLTLESCPCISIRELEACFGPHPSCFNLETLILRDMFHSVARHDSIDLEHPGTFNGERPLTPSPTTDNPIDWRLVHLVQYMADQLSYLGYGSSPVGISDTGSIGEASSARRASALIAETGFNLLNDTVRSMDMVISIRLLDYLRCLSELDGNTKPFITNADPSSPESPSGRFSRLYYALAASLYRPGQLPALLQPPHPPPPQQVSPPSGYACRSVACQTCVCGLLEVDIVTRVSQVDDDTCIELPLHTDDIAPHLSWLSSLTNRVTLPYVVPASNQHPGVSCLGGEFAFAPNLAGNQQGRLVRALAKRCTSWQWLPVLQRNYPEYHARLTAKSTSSAASGAGSGCYVNALSLERDGGCCCYGCCSYRQETTGDLEAELQSISDYHRLHPRPRVRLVRDAAVDTSDILGALARPQAFQINQSLQSLNHANLTTIHFEKVGISHLVLTHAPSLKNITLDCCPNMCAIVFPIIAGNHNGLSLPSGGGQQPVLPALRRIRIIRCPKFAIAHLLFSVGLLFPDRSENLSITFRPFGQYSRLVERALFQSAAYAHVCISHDFRVSASERELDACSSQLSQQFRDLMITSDLYLRSGFEACPSPEAGRHHSIPLLSTPLRIQQGPHWRMFTDIPRIPIRATGATSNVQSTPSPPATVTTSTGTSDSTLPQPSILLTTAGHSSCLPAKLQRRGIHFHVQHRDIHSPISLLAPWLDPNSSHASSYLAFPYTQIYFTRVHPLLDYNVFGDGLDHLLNCLPGVNMLTSLDMENLPPFDPSIDPEEVILPTSSRKRVFLPLGASVSDPIVIADDSGNSCLVAEEAVVPSKRCRRASAE